MSNNLVYDTPRLDDITKFLQRFYMIKIYNPLLELNRDIIYRELCRTGIKASEVLENGELKSTLGMFEMWDKRFKYNPNVLAFNDSDWPYFFQFIHGNMDDSNEYVKMYIPIDSKHLYEGANILFDYIASLKIDHCSKIADVMRSDNVIVRLKKGDYFNAIKIINFIKSNKYLNDGLNKTNPFVPAICGIGVMEESGISYNSELSKYIENYINFCINHNVINVDAQSFTNWMKENCYNEEVQSIYMKAVDERKTVSYSTTHKVNLVIDSLKATFKKYGYNQAYLALRSALIDGNFGYFTNGKSNEPNYRDLLLKKIDRNDLKSIVYAVLEKLYKQNVDNLNVEYAIKYFCEYVLQDLMVKALEEACMVTISKNGDINCIEALHNYYYQNNPNYFSRYKPNDSSKKNYRNVITSFDKDTLLETVKTSLLLKGIDINGLDPDDMFKLYSMGLSNIKHNEKSKVGKL